jgi:hypothetical protein
LRHTQLRGGKGVGAMPKAGQKSTKAGQRRANMRGKGVPKHLRSDGRRLWAWLQSAFDGSDDLWPLATELCQIADRLGEVREQIRKDGVWVNGRKNPLIDIECKLSAQFTKLWRTAGLADKPDVEKRPVGRPTNFDRSNDL